MLEGSEERLGLRQVARVRGDLYKICDEVEIMREQVAGLPSRTDMLRLAILTTLGRLTDGI
jgi:hypothetical protein